MINSNFEVVIEQLVALGNGFSKINGKPIFVPYTCPGDCVQVKILQEKPKFYRGEIIKILKNGKDRVEPFSTPWHRSALCREGHEKHGC